MILQQGKIGIFRFPKTLFDCCICSLTHFIGLRVTRTGGYQLAACKRHITGTSSSGTPYMAKMNFKLTTTEEDVLDESRLTSGNLK